MTSRSIFEVAILPVLLILPACCASAQTASAAMESPTAASVPATPAPLSDPQFQERFPRYRITAGDAMDITFTFSPELNQNVTVEPDGFINLKEVGDVHVQELTTSEVALTVRKAYANILRDPVVTVVLKDFNKPYFIAGGEVHRPGKYELRESTTVAQAVQVAGGFTEAAKHSEVWLYHWHSDGKLEVTKLNVKQMLSKGTLTEDVRLRNGDMLFVPQNTLSKVKGIVSPPRSTVTWHP